MGWRSFWKDFEDDAGEYVEEAVAPDPLNLWGENSEDVNQFNDPLDVFSDSAQQEGKDAAIGGAPAATPGVAPPTEMPIPKSASQTRQANARSKKKRRGRASTILSALSLEDPLGG